MTLVLLEKGLVLEGSTPKIEDKQVPGACISSTTSVFFSLLLSPLLFMQIWGYTLTDASHSAI